MARRVSLPGRIAAAGTVMAMLLMAGCTTKSAPSQAPSSGTSPAPAPAAAAKAAPIKIGALTSLSGPFAPWGTLMRDGMKMAADEINAAGGVNGSNIEIVERDDRNNPDEAVTLLRGLKEKDGVVAAGGVISSGVGLAASREAENLKIPLFLTMSGSHTILTKASHYTFRTSLIAAPENMGPIAAMIKQQGIKKIGAIVADYEWGHAIEDSIKKNISTIPGVQVQIEVAPVSETDFTSYLRKLQGMNPDLLILTGHPPGNVKAAKQAIEMGVGKQSVGSWAPIQSWIDGLGEPGFGKVVEFSAVDFEDAAYQDLAAKYQAQFKHFMDNNAMSGYVIVKMVADAVKRSGSTDPTKVADAIRTGTYKQPGYAFPLTYTDWGELKSPAPILHTFEKGDPGKINPGATWRPKVLFRSPAIEAYAPEK